MAQDVETGSLPLCRWPAQVHNVLDQSLSYMLYLKAVSWHFCSCIGLEQLSLD